MLQTLVPNEKYFMLWTLSVNFDKIFFGTEKLSISNFTFICLVMVMCRKNIFCYWNDVEIIHLIFVSVIVKLQVWSKVQVNGWFCVYCVFKTVWGFCFITDGQMDIGGCRVTFVTENEIKTLWCECSHGIISNKVENLENHVVKAQLTMALLI